jgi:hypothetical protein
MVMMGSYDREIAPRPFKAQQLIHLMVDSQSRETERNYPGHKAIRNVWLHICSHLCKQYIWIYLVRWCFFLKGLKPLKSTAASQLLDMDIPTPSGLIFHQI